MRKYTRDLYARLEAETGQSHRVQAGRVHRAGHRRRTGSRSTGGCPRSTGYCGVDVHEISAARGRASCSRSPAPTTCWPASTWRRTAAPTRSTSPWRWPRAPGCAGATVLEGVAGHRRADSARGGHRRAHAVRRHRGRVRRELRGHVGPPARREVRGEHPAAGGRALLPDHRADRRASTARCRCSRTRRSYGYFREEGGGLMLGLFETVCAPWRVDGIPEDFSFGELPPDWDRMGPVPRDGDVARPDLDGGGRPQVLLRSGELHARPGAGRRRGARAAQLLRGRRAELDRHPHRRRPRSGAGALDRRRAARTSTSPGSTSTGCTRTRPTRSTGATRTVESLGMVYQCHYPGRSMQTARGAKRSAVHDRLVGARRVLPGRQRLGGRRTGTRPRASSRSPGRCRGGGRTGSPYWEAEHRAAREGVIVMDMSFMSKFLVEGRDAGRAARPAVGQPRRRRAGHDHLHASGSTTAGTLEADLTVTKLDDERFWVVASDTAHRHVATWMRRHIGDDCTRTSPTSPPATPSSTCRDRGRASCCSR